MISKNLQLSLLCHVGDLMCDNKYRFYFLLPLLLLLSQPTVSAKIWRVNNIPGTDADFTSLASAVSSANAGDTIHVEPSVNSYAIGNLFITKRIVVIGSGYFLNENSGLQANTISSVLSGTLYFNPGSERSTLQGITTGRIIIGTDSLIIKRNLINSQVDINSGVHNLLIQNHIGGIIYLQAGSSHNRLFNNIVSGIIANQSTDNQIINNVIITNNSDLTNSLIQNNVFNANGSNASITFSNCVVQNNISAGNLPAGDGNQSNVDMNTVFVGTGSTDGQWQLAPGSPALGAGFYDGEDCGAFGVPPGRGWIPYKLSGIPDIPSIYQFSTAIVGDSLQVQISTRSNN